MKLQNDGVSKRDFKDAERLTSYRSPYVGRWSVKGDGSIVLVGPREGFMLTLRPMLGGGWQCLGFPESMLINIEKFMDPQKVGDCKLSRG